MILRDRRRSGVTVTERLVVLHIGMHKTGTTAIQSALQGFDDGRVLYAPFVDINHSIPLFTLFSEHFRHYQVWKAHGLSAAQIETRREGYRRDFEEMLARDDREILILSGEDVGFLADSEKAELVARIEAQGWRLRVVCYVREPVQFAASTFQEWIKSRSLPPSEAYATNYKRRLSFFLGHLPRGDVIVRPFDRRTLADGDIVADFNGIVGVTLDGEAKINGNESMSLDAAKLIHRINRTALVTSGDPITNRAYRKFCEQIVALYADGRKLDPGRFLDCADFSEVAWLKEEFGIDFDTRNGAGAQGDLLKELEDLSDVEMSRVNSTLTGLGLNAENFEGPYNKLQRLYFAYLSERS